MSHFAQVLIQPFNIIINGQSTTVNGGIVKSVIKAEQDFIDEFMDKINFSWIQTSYNTRGGTHYAPSPPNEPDTPDGGTALRANYATVGGYYDSTNDVFYGEQPFPSWTISAPTWTWTPPVPHPQDGMYDWNEETLSWDSRTSQV